MFYGPHDAKITAYTSDEVYHIAQQDTSLLVRVLLSHSILKKLS